jgi:hypothetical protein
VAIVAYDIMRRAGILLQDESNVRWTLAELAEWINDAVRAIVLAQPSASTRVIAIPLQPGTLQAVPADAPAPQNLLSVTRNLRDANSPLLGGRAITGTNRVGIEARSPGWHDERYLRRKREVLQYFVDEQDPLRFWVYPGNDGSGIVEAIVSVLPNPIVASADPILPSSWTSQVGLKDVMATPILDYVLYRAQSKDDVGANAGRASLHFQAFTAAIGAGAGAEARTAPATRRNG